MPDLVLDFIAMNGVLDPRITFVRNSNATYFDSAGNLQTATANVPRFGYDPNTLQPLGLIIELASTNTIQNNAMIGAVAGTPGTQPNLWNVDTTGNGLTRTIVGVGTENNIDFIDIRFAGTPVATIPISIAYSSLTAVSTTPAQIQGMSCFYRLMAGSVSGCAFNQCISGSDGVAYVGDTSIVFVPTSALLRTQRPISIGNLSAFPTVTRVVNRCRVDVTIGVPVDFTLRIGMPQNHSAAIQNHPIRTTAAAVGTLLDNAFMDGTNFTSWYEQGPGTLTMDYVQQNQANGNAASISDVTSANTIRMFANTFNVGIFIALGGATQASIFVNTPGKLPFQRWLSAMTWATNFANVATNGTATIPDITVNLPLTVTRLSIGASESGLSVLGGFIRRLQYFPRVSATDELINLTSDRQVWMGGVLMNDTKPAIRIVKV